MNNTPTYFTVLLPISNNENSLSQCLTSISSQLFTDFNVLCILNNSVDESLQIVINFCNKYTHFSYIELGDSVHNLSQALNCALNTLESKCRYFVRHDADDYMLPHRLLWTYEYLENSLSKPLIHCGNAFINDTSTLIYPNSHNPSSSSLKTSLLLQSPFIHPSICFRSDLNIRYDERFKYAQDLKLLIDYLHFGNYSFDPRPYIYYTFNPPSPQKRILQLLLHDYAINTLHKQLIPGFSFRYSHYLRTKYITNEFTMYSPSSYLDIHSIYNRLQFSLSKLLD